MVMRASSIGRRFGLSRMTTAGLILSTVGFGSPGTGIGATTYFRQDESDSMPQQQDETTTTKHAFTNRLVNETSPYLLQHAHNPVDWYAWGEEAFEAARREQKPIFLSVGYSTCYWCHVMERESFENVETAEQMNRDFISIKVDREARPDVDDIYMKAEQLLNNGSGGWPMSVFLTPPPPEGLRPDKIWEGLQPFWAGTYFPPTQQGGRPSFRQVLTGMRQAWDQQRDDVVKQAQLVAGAVRQELATAQQPVSVGAKDVARAVSSLLQVFDSRYGGFGRAPKFPQPKFGELLMETRDSISDVSQQEQADTAISQTLDKMAMGGVYDQIGGGFHRYSTDQFWLIPHFEKMLYDNGQLMSLYARAAEMTDDAYYREIAGEIGDYVLREMTDPARGGFYSAQDAEVDGHEGQNYLWTKESVQSTLKAGGIADEVIGFVLEAYGLNRTNFRDPHHPEDEASNVIYLTKHPTKLAEDFAISVDEVNDRLRKANAVLLAARNKRKQARLDDKVVVSWNGLMIAGLADAGRVLRRSDFVEGAGWAWKYIDTNLRDESGNLLRTARGGVVNDQPAFSEDYAMLAKGLIALYRGTSEENYLASAADLVNRAHALFWDSERGGYFDTLEGRSDLFVRGRSAYDGAIPSANSVMLNDLVDLYEITGDSKYLDQAIDTLRSVSPDIKQSPISASNSVRALHRLIELAPERVASMVARTPTIKVGEGIGGGGGNQTSADLPDPVKVSASSDNVSLSANGTSTLMITLEVGEGYHVNAHDPGDPNLRGLEIRVAGATGVTAKVDYPKSDVFSLGGNSINVYTGKVAVPVALSVTGKVQGKPVLVVSYQVCNDEICLAPKDVVLPVVIGVGGRG